MKTTKSTSAAQINREWHLIDVKGKPLGRIATDIAKLLMGKSKSYFVKNLDCGDYVVITNAATVGISGKKLTDKEYYRYSGYPGGLSIETMGNLQKRKPEEIVRLAVKGMLPQNRLRDRMLSRLFIFAGDTHAYADKFENSAKEIAK